MFFLHFVILDQLFNNKFHALGTLITLLLQELLYSFVFLLPEVLQNLFVIKGLDNAWDVFFGEQALSWLSQVGIDISA